MRKTKKQKRFESLHWLMYGSEFYKNKPKSLQKLPIHGKKFRIQNFRNLILGLRKRIKGNFTSTASVLTRGISFDFKTNSFNIRTDYF